jgi:hypothetical protein
MKQKLEFKTSVMDLVTRDWSKKKRGFRSKVNASAERAFNAVTDAYRAGK